MRTESRVVTEHLGFVTMAKSRYIFLANGKALVSCFVVSLLLFAPFILVLTDLKS